MAIALVAGALAACGGEGSRDYVTGIGDDEFDLSAMQVREIDMPDDGLLLVVDDTFTNEEWAAAFEAQDPDVSADQRLIQLDAQGRVLGYLTLFAWENPIEHLGKVQQIESHSTIYRDVEAAQNAMTLRACGLLIADDAPLEPFEVPDLADEAAGFFRETTVDPLGTQVDTVVCFRTGRLVHAIVQNGLDGTQDTELSVRLAERKLEYVDAAFDGKDPPEADES